MASRLVHQPGQVRRLRLARDLGLSPREFNGHIFSTTQRGYNEAGKSCPVSQAFTIVTELEPRWSDDDRAQMLGLAFYEAGICGGCGYHDDLKDPARHKYQIEISQCPVCASTERFRRKVGADDEAEAKRVDLEHDPTQPLASDGRRISVRPTQ